MPASCYPLVKPWELGSMFLLYRFGPLTTNIHAYISSLNCPNKLFLITPYLLGCLSHSFGDAWVEAPGS